MTNPEDPTKNMMSAGELRKLAADLRNDKAVEVDEALVKRINADIGGYRAMFESRPEQVPFAPLDELIPLMGWVIYEGTWDAVQKIPATLNKEAATEEGHRQGMAMLERISDLAESARALPWPEFAPRALGAIRSQALAESKRDTEASYDAAWTAHMDARRRYHSYRDSHAIGQARDRFVQDLEEVVLQLDLAETGTACRTAERVISRWAEEFADDPEQRWIERMFRELTTGVAVGEHAIDAARRIKETYGFVENVTEKQLTLGTALQNPGVMTARAASLLLALGPEMRRLGLEPVGFATWKTWEEHVLSRFKKAYEAIEDRVIVNGKVVEIRSDLRRQLIHMRLNLALLKPGHHLPSTLSYEPCLQYATLDAEALEALSAFLAGPEGSRGQERGIGAATMPSFIRSVIACRSQGPDLDDHGYEEWRERWFRLDRYAGESARRKNVTTALAAARSE
jgi:hypothetical protein